MSALLPRLRDGVYAFVCVAPDTSLAGLDVVASIRESEGLTLVLPVDQALDRGFVVLWQGRWITLELATELAMVGLTSRFATALASQGIACNVLAGAHHDHLFVPSERADEAVGVLQALST